MVDIIKSDFKFFLHMKITSYLKTINLNFQINCSFFFRLTVKKTFFLPSQCLTVFKFMLNVKKTQWSPTRALYSYKPNLQGNKNEPKNGLISKLTIIDAVRAAFFRQTLFPDFITVPIPYRRSSEICPVFSYQ